MRRSKKTKKKIEKKDISLPSLEGKHAVKEIYIRKLPLEEARELFLRELEKAFIRGYTHIQVIHGIGKGVLKNMIEEELTKISYAKLLYTRGGVSYIELYPPSRDVLKKFLF